MDLSGKKVCVFGMGRSGMAALKLLKRESADIWAINKGVLASWSDYQTVCELIGQDRCISEENADSIFAQADLIILSPGIPRTNPVLEKAHINKVPIISEIELGFRFADAPIIAVTGSNGKTTTVMMIKEILEASGYAVFTGGNIGNAFCNYALEDKKADYIVLELSSFQLESIIDFRPNVAMILNIYPNHGERYEGVTDYAEAKFNLSANMITDDLLIYPSDFTMIKEWGDKQACKKISLNTLDIKSIKMEFEQKFDLSGFKLVGEHNLLNLYFALKAMKNLKIRRYEISMQQVINSFTGVPYRIQYIESKDQFIAYNDGKSTNWDATLTAIRSFKDNPKDLYLILGGKKRGKNDSITPYLDSIKKKVKRIFLIGETTDFLACELDGKIGYEKCRDLSTAVQTVREEKFTGNLLLSPAFPSFDQYKNYEKRGEHFTELLS